VAVDNQKSMKILHYSLAGLVGLTGFLFAFFEQEHRSFEGWPVTLLFSVVAAFFATLWVLTMKFVRIESGGVYGRQHDRIVSTFGNAWQPLKLGMLALGLVGLGSVAGGLLIQKMASTQGITVLAATCSSYALCHYFEKKQRLRHPSSTAT